MSRAGTDGLYDDQADDYLEYKGDAVFRVNASPVESQHLVLLIGELSVIIRPGPESVLVDIKSYPDKGPCEEILHARSFVRYNPDDEGEPEL